MPSEYTEFEISDVFSVYLAIFRNILLLCKATEVPVVVSCVGGGSGFSDPSPHFDTEFEMSDVFSVYSVIFSHIVVLCKAAEAPAVITCVGGGSGLSDGISAFGHPIRNLRCFFGTVLDSYEHTRDKQCYGALIGNFRLGRRKRRVPTSYGFLSGKFEMRV